MAPLKLHRDCHLRALVCEDHAAEEFFLVWILAQGFRLPFYDGKKDAFQR
jgi:hypothetical protein